jgi:hypothetical protein
LADSPAFYPNLDIFSTFTSLPLHQFRDPIPRALRNATLELASNNLICSVALTGVIALQAGRYWAESADSDDDEDFVVVEPPVELDNSDVSAAARGRKSRGKTPEISIREDKVKLLQHRVQTS